MFLFPKCCGKMGESQEKGFPVTIEPTEASTNNNLFPGRKYKLYVNSGSLMLEDEHNILIQWTMEYIRRFGVSNSGVFSIETGRRSETGVGVFSFHCENAQHILNKIELQRKLFHYKNSTNQQM